MKSSTVNIYDLILFPHLLEISMKFINKNIESQIQCVKFNQYSINFLKRLAYLLQTCNFNIQIILNNVIINCKF